MIRTVDDIRWCFNQYPRECLWTYPFFRVEVEILDLAMFEE